MSRRDEQRATLIQRIGVATAIYHDEVLPASVAVQGAIQAVLDVLDGNDEHPGYVVFPKTNEEEVVLGVVRAMDDDGSYADQDINLAGNLAALFKEINS